MFNFRGMTGLLMTTSLQLQITAESRGDKKTLKIGRHLPLRAFRKADRLSSSITNASTDYIFCSSQGCSQDFISTEAKE